MDPQRISRMRRGTRKATKTRRDPQHPLLGRIKKITDSFAGSQELACLHEIFESLYINENGTEIFTQSAFISFLQNTGLLPPPMTKSGALAYRSFLYIPQAPFYDLHLRP